VGIGCVVAVSTLSLPGEKEPEALFHWQALSPKAIPRKTVRPTMARVA